MLLSRRSSEWLLTPGWKLLPKRNAYGWSEYRVDAGFAENSSLPHPNFPGRRWLQGCKIQMKRRWVQEAAASWNVEKSEWGQKGFYCARDWWRVAVGCPLGCSRAGVWLSNDLSFPVFDIRPGYTVALYKEHDSRKISISKCYEPPASGSTNDTSESSLVVVQPITQRGKAQAPRPPMVLFRLIGASSEAVLLGGMLSCSCSIASLSWDWLIGNCSLCPRCCSLLVISVVCVSGWDSFKVSFGDRLPGRQQSLWEKGGWCLIIASLNWLVVQWCGQFCRIQPRACQEGSGIGVVGKKVAARPSCKGMSSVSSTPTVLVFFKGVEVRDSFCDVPLAGWVSANAGASNSAISSPQAL